MASVSSCLNHRLRTASLHSKERAWVWGRGEDRGKSAGNLEQDDEFRRRVTFGEET